MPWYVTKIQIPFPPFSPPHLLTKIFPWKFFHQLEVFLFHQSLKEMLSMPFKFIIIHRVVEFYTVLGKYQQSFQFASPLILKDTMAPYKVVNFFFPPIHRVC